MRQTTNRNYPYPESTDLLTAGATSIQLLAEKLDRERASVGSTNPADWLQVQSGWQLTDGELFAHNGLTYMRVTVRRSGSALWSNGGGVPNQTGVHIATWKNSHAVYGALGPLPWFPMVALQPSTGGSGTTYNPRGAGVQLRANGELHLSTVDAFGSAAAAINTDEHLCFGGTWPNSHTIYPPA